MTSPVPLPLPLDLPRTPALVLRGQTFDAARPAVMAIVNRTKDSFWAGNRHAALDDALAALHQAVSQGADIVDVGGVRAGQEGEQVSPAQEIDRVVPFLEAARTAYPDLVLSLDTWRSEVAEAAGDLVDLVNDTWAGHDPELVGVAARAGAGFVCSHTNGLPPRTDPVDVRYADEHGSDELAVVRDVLRTLARGAERAVAAGVPAERVLVDPTLDFGKTTRNSLATLRHTADVAALGFPVLQALSRKDFVGETLDLPADERLEGTLAATALAAWLGTTVFRAHDVRATRRVVDMVASVRGDRPPALSVRGEPVVPPAAAQEGTPGECPVVLLADGTWAVRGHADVLHVATTPEVYASGGRRHLHVPNAMDGDVHRRFRAVVDRHLDDAVIGSLEPMITQVCDEAAAELLAGGPGVAVDALHDYGRQVAVRVQSRWLGWPASLEEELLAWIEENFAATASRDPLRTGAVAAHFDRIVHEVVQARRDLEARGEPLPDDPTTRLLHDEVEDPEAPGGRRPLTDPELVSMLRNWTAGDLGSIAACVGVVVHHVARDPRLQEELRALARDEALHTQELDAAVDEMLRIDDPFPSNHRVVTRPTELAGYRVPEGTRVAVNWTAANRDESVFGDPDAYRPAENRASNIVYGAGPHVCPGRLLSTLQIRGALAALLRATTRIVPHPEEEPARETWPSRGWARVPVLLDPRG